MSKRYFLGLFGLQNSGKTSAANLCFRIETAVPSDEPTLTPRAYSNMRKKNFKHIFVVDFPAFNDLSQSQKEMQLMILDVVVAIPIFLSHQIANTKEGWNLVNKACKIAKKSKVLVFITHMDQVGMKLQEDDITMDVEDEGDPFLNKISPAKDLTLPFLMESRFLSISASLYGACKNKNFSMYPACLSYPGCELMDSLKVLCKFDYSAKFEFNNRPILVTEKLDESSFVIYGPRGIRRVIWEHTHNLFNDKEQEVRKEWEELLHY